MSHPARPKISVVIPIYNPDTGYLKECLNSVAKQTFSDFEVIISDDNPSKENEKLVGEYGCKKFQYKVNEGPRGIFSNLNNAIECASGEYLQIFCQDDRMYPNYLAEQRRVLQKYPGASFVYSQSDVIDEKGETITPCTHPNTPDKRDMLVASPKAIDCFFKYGCLPGNLSTVMMRRSLVQEFGPFDVSHPFAGDFKYWVDSILRHDFAINLAPLLAVRNHDYQASKTIGAAQWAADAVPLYRILLGHLSAPKSKLHAKLFINEHFGVQSFYAIVKEALGLRRPSLLKKLRILNQKPFSLPLILGLSVLTLRQKFQLFELKEIQLFEK
jgi:glycosyltransferase involved in cell wall biosynthesis